MPFKVIQSLSTSKQKKKKVEFFQILRCVCNSGTEEDFCITLAVLGESTVYLWKEPVPSADTASKEKRELQQQYHLTIIRPGPHAAQLTPIQSSRPLYRGNLKLLAEELK